MIVVGSDSHTSVHGALGTVAVALGNDSHAGTVLPHSKAWFKVPETARVELTGTPPPAATARDVALWLLQQLGEGSQIYKAVEFAGPYIQSLGFWDRWLFPLLCVDLGGKCSFVEPDEVTRAFVESLPGGLDQPLVSSDPGDAVETIRIDVSEVVPVVACPPTVGNVHPATGLAGTPVLWAELGGHGGGRLEDIALAAQLLEGRQVHPDVNFNIVPSSREVFAQAERLGYVRTLFDAGATWFPPSTGSNQAVNMGAMAPGEAMITTHSRNYPGRNGSPQSSTYLASAATVAATAVAGSIVDPSELISRPTTHEAVANAVAR
jgi:3-isopropylmalate/(R)-2-methylmalate dehydratase large subunit